MATPTEDTIQTYISITGASHSLALQKLQEYGGDLNEAVNAHFREGEVHSTSPLSPAYPQYNIPQTSNQNQAAPQGLLQLSADRSFKPSLLLDPNNRGDLYNRIGSALTGRAPSPSHSPGASAEVTGVPVGFNPGNEQWQQPHFSGQRPTSQDVGRNDLHASQHGNDVEEEMIQAAIEASKQEAEVRSLNMWNRPVNVSYGNVLGEKIPEENSDLDRAVSLSLETAEQEKAMREMQLKDKTQGKLALHSDELGNLSPEELNEAMMLEAALFGESSHAPNMQHVALSSSSLSARQFLGEQQNDEYLSSLIADKEKGINAVNQAATSQLKEVNNKMVEPMELERRPDEKNAPLPCEPAPEDENAVTLPVRMPNGSRLSRRFRKSEKLQGLNAFYGLQLPHTLVELTAGVPHSLPQGVQFEFQTLPVDAKAVGDGDGVTVYVSTADPRESSCVPNEVKMATIQRSEAREKKNYTKANALHQQIIDAGYRVLSFQNEDILARKYRIRLRGIDAPEIEMPYGKEAKDELVKLLQGKCLRVLVYGVDRYGRCVGDIYSNGIFAQEVMLKKGFAWHYTAYDQRLELAGWEKEAQVKRIGLWASSNPEKPWDWRRNRRHKGPDCRNDLDASQYGSDVEEEMIQDAIEASKQEAEVGSLNMRNRPVNVSSGNVLGEKIPEENSDLDRAVLLSLKTAEQEKAMREMQLKDKTQDKLALYSDELGNLSPEELNEAMMLETALFGESSHALNMQHVALSSSSLSARQLLREQQNDEYLASLIADKEKGINTVNQAATSQLKEVNNKRELERRPAEKNAPLPCEAEQEDENAVTLLVRMPNGSRLSGRFCKSDKLQLLFDFIDVGKVVEPGTYRLVRLYPRQALTAENRLSTLSELGLTNKQEALFLELI